MCWGVDSVVTFSCGRLVYATSVLQHVNSLAGAISSILCKCWEMAMLNLWKREEERVFQCVILQWFWAWKLLQNTRVLTEMYSDGVYTVLSESSMLYSYHYLKNKFEILVLYFCINIIWSFIYQFQYIWNANIVPECFSPVMSMKEFCSIHPLAYQLCTQWGWGGLLEPWKICKLTLTPKL